MQKRRVNVLDLTNLFLENRNINSLYCKQNTHWSGQDCVAEGQGWRKVPVIK